MFGRRLTVGVPIPLVRVVVHQVDGLDELVDHPVHIPADEIAVPVDELAGDHHVLAERDRLGDQRLHQGAADALSASIGLPDIGLVTLSEFVAEARRIAAATDLPLLCDADTGFGEAMSVERTVWEFEAAGAAGSHLEDQVLPKRCGHLSGKSLVEPAAMCGKLRAAVAAKRNSDFVIVARTDARGVTGFDDAIDRAKCYLDAGADAIFPEALQKADEFKAFAREVKAPLLANMTEFGNSPLLSFQELSDFGYRMVIFPQSAFRVSMKASEECLRDLKRQGTQSGWIERMQTREQLYELLDYDPAAKEWLGLGD